MKTTVMLIIAFAMVVVSQATALETYPSGNETFYIAPFGYEFDPSPNDILWAVEESWYWQGYISGINNRHFKYTPPTNDNPTMLIDDLIWILRDRDPRPNVVQIDTHGYRDWITIEAYA